MKYLIGIDNGGTVTKAAVFDTNGKQLSSASERIALITPCKGYAERDMAELWKANAKAIKAAIKAAGVNSAEIAGVAVSGHGKGLYIVDKGGNPVYNGIVSTDTRAHAEEKMFNAEDTAKKIFQMNFQKILSCQPVCLLRWFKDNLPEIYNKIGWILSVKDYIRFCLTGEIYAERTDISGSNLLNLKTGQYDKAITALFGISEMDSCLPMVKNSAEICGYITKQAAEETGLTEGTPVAGGMFDIDACALGMGIVDDKKFCMIAGTWSINEYITEAPVADGSIGMNSYYCIPKYYLAEECSPTSAGNLEWVLKTFFESEIALAGGMNSKFFKHVDEMAGSVAHDQTEILFLPFLFDSNESSKIKACFYGMIPSDTKASVLRAVYEGIVFSHRRHMDRLLKSRNGRGGAVRLAGGAANSPLWAQMFADILGMTIEVVEDREHGCYGAALAAGIAVGLYTDFIQAVGCGVKVSRTHLPDISKKEIYDKKYAQYIKLAQSLSNMT